MIHGPLKWHGGKGAFNGKLAKWIVSLMPDHLHYVEPYAGGLSVLLAKDPEGYSEVANDIHGDLSNFWSVLASESQFQEFHRTVSAIPFSEAAFQDSRMTSDHSPDVHRAVCFFVRCRQSMSGRMKSFAPLTRNRTRSGMNEQASAWISSVDGLPEVHRRLRRVVVLNRDAISVIRQQDGEKTLFYLDPPYLHSTRSSTGEYEFEMSDSQHASLLSALGEIKGRFLLSGYDSPLYESARLSNGWNRHDFETVNNSSKSKKKEVRVESVWANF